MKITDLNVGDEIIVPGEKEPATILIISIKRYENQSIIAWKTENKPNVQMDLHKFNGGREFARGYGVPAEEADKYVWFGFPYNDRIEVDFFSDNKPLAANLPFLFVKTQKLIVGDIFAIFSFPNKYFELIEEPEEAENNDTPVLKMRCKMYNRYKFDIENILVSYDTFVLLMRRL